MSCLPITTTSKLANKSPAQFFAENHNIAGFDNPGKSLYTSIREFVENSLDAAESVKRLPRIEIRLEHMDLKQFNEFRGVQQVSRQDMSLYADKKKGKKKSVKADENGDLPKEDDPENRHSGAEFFTVTCKDNGMGMPHESIPNMLGIVLSSTKYGVKQSRGKFGLGAKMALVWSKKSTAMPVEVYTSQDGAYLSYCKLDIDIYKNTPRVILHQKLDNPRKWIGTEISITIEGKWSAYKSKIISYLRQLAIITPYAEFEFRYSRKGSPSKNLTIEFARRTDKMPDAAPEVKHHPSAVDNLLFEALVNQTNKRKLHAFLSSEFSNINSALAKRLIAELGAGFDEEMLVKSLNKKQIHQITRLLREAKFRPPSGDSLRPAGEYNLRLGIFKEIQPDLVSTWKSSPQVYEGHPFIVEAGVSLGGKDAKVGVTIYRFANRIPLLFEAGSDVSTIVANTKVKWAYYKIRPKLDKVGVFISIVSTKIPFKSSSKEYIGDDKEGGVIHETVKEAIIQCCKQLKTKISRQSTLKDQQDRKRNISKYIPDVSRAVFGMLSIIADPSQEVPNKKPKFNGQLISVDLLKQKLEEHVSRMDKQAALEVMTATGRMQSGTEKVYLGSDADAQRLPEIVHPTCHFSIQLLR